MRYTMGLGRRMVVNSDTSTLPPACMHAVRVGVRGMDVGVCGMVGVGVGVLGSARMVAVIGFVEVTWGVWSTNVAGDSWVVV